MAKTIKDLDYYLNGIKSGNKYILAEAITLAESTHSHKKQLAGKLIEKCIEYSKQNTTCRIAITGSPGAGKSTLINALGESFVDAGYRVAVLAIDPSSQQTKGSILGDKTRMYELSQRENTFIRPTASGAYLGGIHRKTKESILLCEAAGYTIILVETVGVGQSEIEVSNLTDMTILVLQPGAGDDLQGIKRGIMEIADVLAVNKSDGELLNAAQQTFKFYSEAIKYYPQKHQGINIKATMCSALTNLGIEELRDLVIDLHRELTNRNLIESMRLNQEILNFENNLKDFAIDLILKDKKIQELVMIIKEDLKNGKINSIQAINKLQLWSIQHAQIDI